MHSTFISPELKTLEWWISRLMHKLPVLLLYIRDIQKKRIMKKIISVTVYIGYSDFAIGIKDLF